MKELSVKIDSKAEDSAFGSQLAREAAAYDNYRKQNLSLDMTRGKPSPEQLAMVSSLGLDLPLEEEDYVAEDGSDIRNYGLVYGLPEARKFFSSLIGVPMKQIMVLNSSSLNLMYDFMVKAMMFPLPGCQSAWRDASAVKVLCPAPGYDRHFQMAKSLGAELVPVRMTAEGPDMDEVEQLVQDPAVKAMFCVPLYSNPGGVVYSEETCRRMASMKTFPDFRIVWDNAYCMHHLDWDNPRTIPEILHLTSKEGNPDRFFTFFSTSKITYAGGGLAALAASPADFAWFAESLKFQTIGPDKLNQRRHLKFFSRNGGVETIMRKHAEIIRPKFDLVLDILEKELGGTGLAEWSKPEGGYFISLDLQPGMAQDTVRRAKEAGVAFTPAGATFPGGHDPLDRNIRLAPTYPSLEDIETAMKVLVNCVKLSALERRL